MTEPTLDRGDTWERFRERKIAEKASVEVALSFSLPWYRQQELKTDAYELWFEIDYAETMIGEPV